MPPKHFYQFGRFRLNSDGRHLLRDSEVVSLTPKEFELLLVLIRHSGKLVTYAEMKKAVWPELAYVEDKTLTQTIYTLRGSLGDSSKEQRYIENVPRRGYRFAAEVTERWADDEEKIIARDQTEPTSAQQVPPASNEKQKDAWWYVRASVLPGAVLLLCIVLGMALVRQPAPPADETKASPPEGRAEIRSPSDEVEVKRVVKESQFYETLTIYANPKSFNKEQLSEYWLPGEQGGKAIKEVEAAVKRLLNKGWHYGKESKAERFEFRYVRIFSPRDYAEVGTEERWYVPAYREDGSKVLDRNEYLGPYPVDYTLRKVNGRWLIEENSTPRPAINSRSSS